MLALPETGMRHSVNAHNVDLDVLCDWIEASIVFEDERVSRSDVVDMLMESNIYEEQDFAAERVEAAWGVLKERARLLGAPIGLSVTNQRLVRNEDWTAFPAYAFCLALSCTTLYPSWAAAWRKVEGSTAQGELFERITEKSFANNLSGWQVSRVGWSPGNAVKLKDAVAGIIRDLREVYGAEWDVHVDGAANELGLDLLAFKPFDDLHASFLVLMVQCASGENWKSKRTTPDLTIWRKVINFNSNPVRGMAIPFAFAEASEFRKQSTPVNGIFVDRNRLLAPLLADKSKELDALNADIAKWLEPKANLIPRPV